MEDRTLEEAVLGPVDWAQEGKCPILGSAWIIPRGATRSTLALEVRAVRRCHRSVLGHYATGFGVSLGKDIWGLLWSERLPPKSHS